MPQRKNAQISCIRIDLGLRLKQAREFLGYTCQEAAELLGYDRQSLYRWEWGSVEPPLWALLALAELYEVEIGWLMNGRQVIPAIEQQ